MKFKVKTNKSMSDVVRTVGYSETYLQDGGQVSVVKKLGGDYPRFHLYIKKENDGFNFDLHLDQKKPSYGGSHAHSGEYDGELIEQESERIKSFFKGA
ncbi:MAG: hypothetical protein A2639_01810 [Candidatus Staskawiczbacteria bacterium RIFCSPHIGHO2_01_FULL_34_27]|uniref:Uncharacterized protein n=2 Tax=Candidatus Staskawicziibacteriota TaxID=1817916 RepID=A0A1G2HL06_9BACT|nr:MAG: hypothetical protein A2639_01810 [Candidatus Staskawiczbacteria bacterium RIFCSPHIGHO2_01_FULL_34_27]OGZ69732.1 MAG: hypothetical protein A3D35_02070 [Candidatus Staskawiczbacteria bacterium RIFCSPHIGHO2_02_FULL_34_9]